jgi:exodeoxyribonuclease VIII
LIHGPDVVPMAAYHAAPGISKSGLDLAARTVDKLLCPPPRPESPPDHFAFGSAVNDAILMPDEFVRRYRRAPECGKRSKAEKEAWGEAQEEARAEGAVLIPTDLYQAALEWRDAAYSHPKLRSILDGAKRREVTVVWEDETGLLCRCRPDILTDSGNVIDIKSARNGEWGAFRAAVFGCRYYLSAAFTATGVERVTGHAPGYVFAVLDKGLRPAPESIAFYQLDEDFRLRGLDEARRDLERLAGYLSAADRGDALAWAGYPQDIQLISYSRGASA